jgi:hypothetical protein
MSKRNQGRLTKGGVVPAEIGTDEEYNHDL